MAEYNTSPEKPKRGRPRKQEAKPLVNEEPQLLEMSAGPSSDPSLQTVKENLHLLYDRILGGAAHRPMWTGNLYNLQMYNPFLQNHRLKMLNTQPGEMTREELTNALKHPQDRELQLRAEAWSLASQQYLYYKILRLAADVPMYKWYLTPELLPTTEYSSKDFIEEDKFVNNWIETFDPVNTLKRIAFEVKREGKQTYVLRTSVTRDKSGQRKTAFATWQKMPSDYIKLVKIGEHGFVAAFNMMVFMNPAFSPNQYPDFIRDIWNDMVECGAISRDYLGTNEYFSEDKKKKFKIDPNCIDFDKLSHYSYAYRNTSTGSCEDLTGTLEITGGLKKTYMFWVQLPQELCYTFCSDTSNPWVIPDTAGLLLSLDELADYDTLQGLIDSTPLTAILTAEAETISGANPGQDQTVLNPETIAGLQDKFNDSTSTNLEALFAPLKNFKLLTLPSQPNGSDISSTATKNVINRAGLGGLIITTDKPSVSQTRVACQQLESECAFVTNQFESVLNLILHKVLGCNYYWKLHLWGYIFSFADEVKRDKELLISGVSFVLPKIASALDFSLRDTRAVQHYIESLDIYSDLKTITQEQQEQPQGGSGNGQVGRAAKDEGEIDNDNTAASKDTGLDTADTRVFDGGDSNEN